MILRAQGLTKSYGGRQVLSALTLQVNPGSIVGLLGPNGAGKTTAFRILAGLEVADAGSVWLGEVQLGRRSLWARVQRGLGYLPQRPSLLGDLTVLANVALPAEARGQGRAEATAQARTLLEDDGLAHLAAAPARTLSGGERRRVELARCLAAQPAVLLLDEPFAGVDPVAVEGLQDRIRGLAHAGLGVLITDHAVHATLPLCDQAAVLDQGRTIATGSPAQIATDAQVRARYLGPRFALNAP